MTWPPAGASRHVETGDDIRWRVVEVGRGPVLFAVHGTGSSSHSFAGLADALAGRFTFIAPDLPRHGDSGGPPSFRPTLRNTAVALSRLVETLGVQPEVMVGHSAGAAILLRGVLDGAWDPELLVGLGAAVMPLRGLPSAVFPPSAALLSSSGWATRLLARRLARRSGIERLLSDVGSRLGSGGIEEYRRLASRPEHLGAVLSMLANWNLEGLYAALPRVRTPVLLLAGAKDRAVPLHEQRSVKARLPNAGLEVLEGVGHLLHEERPDLVAARIRRAHEELPPRGRPSTVS